MSDDVEHTPGPWEIEDGHWDIEVTKGEYVIATAHAAVPNGGLKENARLISAAPELLEASKQLLQAVSAEAGTCTEVSPPVREQICSDARDAIAKAKGRHE
ncbi:hypothetical protein GGP77_001603 [Salinibacter ruber]|uniref:hypothetical protein n=1 Tax=Salinibacter ruber TaxID=146919 RepID=UPI0021689479|nr:hypothetical protein [Salinibacter ruber]MCS3667374.1 hypothetical protein [Salinibacter ruber]